jgi:hypothetical protein
MTLANANKFQQPGAAEAGGYVLIVAGLLVAAGLVFHPLPARGFAESPSVLESTPWWGIIHVAIAAGFVLCALGGLLILVGGGSLTRRWPGALFWGALTVGMIYFTGVALINGWVMHKLSPYAAQEKVLYDAMNDLLIGFGWLGNPLFLFGLTGITIYEAYSAVMGMRRWGAASARRPDSISSSRSSSLTSRRFCGWGITGIWWRDGRAPQALPPDSTSPAEPQSPAQCQSANARAPRAGPLPPLRASFPAQR